MRILSAIVVLIAFVPGARASDDCSTVFGQWVKLSESRIRKQRTEDGLGAGRDKRAAARGACIPSEVSRQELLRALSSAKAKCEASSSSDQTAQQTKTLIAINRSFLASIALCRVDEPPEHVPKAAPDPPRHVARPRACLEISRARPDRYVLSNKRCSGSTVLAIIETRRASGETECKAHTIDQKATITAPNKMRPYINYECPVGQEKCTNEHLAVMFPECDW